MTFSLTTDCKKALKLPQEMKDKELLHCYEQALIQHGTQHKLTRIFYREILKRITK